MEITFAVSMESLDRRRGVCGGIAGEMGEEVGGGEKDIHDGIVVLPTPKE